MTSVQRPYHKVTLQLGERDLSTTHHHVVEAARELDHDGDTLVTMREVKAGTTAQRRELFAALTSEYGDRLEEWRKKPVLQAIGSMLIGDPDKKALLRLATVADEVGALPDVGRALDRNEGTTMSLMELRLKGPPRPSIVHARIL